MSRHIAPKDFAGVEHVSSMLLQTYPESQQVLYSNRLKRLRDQLDGLKAWIAKHS
jgi:hypothetical protein